MQFLVPSETLQGLRAPRLDAVLARLTSQSRSFIQSQILLGHVQVNGVPARKAGHLVKPGDTIEGQLVPEAQEPSVLPVAAELEILFEDAELLALNKPQGLVVHPAPSHSGETLVHYLLHHLQMTATNPDQRAGIVHRLDKGTSGVLLVAKNRKIQEALSDAFKARQIKKTYEALAWGTFSAKQGRFISSIGRDRIHRLKMSSRTQNGRQAITDWRAEAAFRHFTHISLFPHTGRTHQLRVHLSENGHPVLGDPTYGRGLTQSRRLAVDPQIAAQIENARFTFLHAARLELIHPTTGQTLVLQAPRPREFDELLLLLQEYDR